MPAPSQRISTTMAQRAIDPSPEEIQAALVRIRAGWNARTEANRRCQPASAPVTVTRCVVREDALGRVIGIYNLE